MKRNLKGTSQHFVSQVNAVPYAIGSSGSRTLEEHLFSCCRKRKEEGRSLHSLAGVVVAEGKDTDNTCPGSCNLPGELAGGVLSVGAETEEATKSNNSDGVTKDDRVVAVGLGLLCGLLCLLLGLLLELLGLLLGLLSLLFGLLSLLASLGLKTFALGLGLGLDFLRLEVGGDG